MPNDDFRTALGPPRGGLEPERQYIELKGFGPNLGADQSGTRSVQPHMKKEICQVDHCAPVQLSVFQKMEDRTPVVHLVVGSGDDLVQPPQIRDESPFL